MAQKSRKSANAKAAEVHGYEFGGPYVDALQILG
jgi:hypothetical protein